MHDDMTCPDFWLEGARGNSVATYCNAPQGKKDAAVRLLQVASEQGLCVYPLVDRDPLFNKIRDSTEFKA